MKPVMLDPLIVALTPRARELGQRLVQGIGQGEVVLAQGSLRETLTEAFAAGRPLVCVMALGIVVRTLGPQLRDKKSDPAVLAVDEGGRFVIPVLGGHAAGANDLARRAAETLGAVPVITTASDALGLPGVDLIGRAWGWQIEGTEHLTALAAATVRGEPVGVWQDAGQRDWWEAFGTWPTSFARLDKWPPAGRWSGLLVISDRALEVEGHGPAVVYRPPTLVLGVGCRRGVPRAEIAELFQQVCHDEGVSPLSLGVVATAVLKLNEPGLVEFAAGQGAPLWAYTLTELAGVGPLPTPSETVRARVGIAGVAEPAAMLAAQSRSLLMPKRRGGRVTMALARRGEA
jgi:cobalamin biosynthesis protein CbiG